MVQTLSGQWYLWLVPLFVISLLLMIPASLAELGFSVFKKKKTVLSTEPVGERNSVNDNSNLDEDEITQVLIAAAAAYISSQKKHGGNKMRNLKITINGKTYDVSVEEENSGYEYTPRFSANKTPASAAKPAVEENKEVVAPVVEAATKTVSGEGAKVEAPMSGRIVEICVKEGASVKAGDAIVVMEAMKLQSEICAECDGTVKQILVKEKQDITTGDVVAVIG